MSVSIVLGGEHALVEVERLLRGNSQTGKTKKVSRVGVSTARNRMMCALFRVLI